MRTWLQQKAALPAIAGVAAIGVFAGGAALGYTVNGSSESPSDTPTSPGFFPRPGNQDSDGRAGGPQIGFPPLGNRGWAGNEFAARDAELTYPYNQCPAPVGNLFEGSSLDLSRQGFAMNLLRDGFTLTGMSVRAEGECDDQGRASSGNLVLDTTWTHTETGLDVWVSQRAGAEPTPNLRHNEGAQFWADGYGYSVWVSTHWYYPMEDAGASDGVASDTDIARYPAQPDPRIPGVVDAALAQLAPGISAQCFYTEQAGSWEDLAAAGLGDPRSAIPSGFSESHFEFRAFRAPDAGCPGADLEAPGGSSFYAGFSSSSGDGWIDISGWRSGESERKPYPGWSDDYSMSWTAGDWQLSVNGHTGSGGLGVDALTAIARALDSSFNNTCFVQQRDLSASELEALGFRQPVAPDGYTISASTLRVTELPEGCEGGEDVGVPAYGLAWTITNGDTTFEVNVNRWPGGAAPDTVKGYISDYGMSWISDAGDSYNIWASAQDASGTPDRDAMVAIAQSLDPALDISSLTEEQGGSSPGRPVPMPEPARDAN